MYAKDTPPISTDSDVVAIDLGPLAWVLDELRKSLDGAAKALKRFVREAEAAKGSDLATLDASQLRIARQQLHQAVGALEMVGLSGPAVVLRSMETAVQKFVQQPDQCSPDAAAKIESASFALTEYLEAVLAGKTISAVSLFPQFRDVQELVRADRVHPADLWLNDWRWIEPALNVQGNPKNYDADARATFDQATLQIMKGQASPAAGYLAELSLGFVAKQADQQPRIFWKIAAAYFEALSNDLLVPDLYVRRAASRILLQYASLSEGNVGISDRLAHDLLFFCAQARFDSSEKTPVLAAVRSAYALHRHKAVDYLKVQFGRFDPALLAQARKRILTAKESWSALSAGDLSKLKAVADQFSLISDSLIKLHPSSEPLALALTRAVEVTVRSAQPPVIELAMEVATSILYLEVAFEDQDSNDAQLTGRTLHLSERLETVKNGGMAQPLEPWMEELYRRVSDKQTMGSVVGELRVSLGEVEKSMDAFFRQPKDKNLLSRVPGQLAQMRGVLSVLGLDQASLAVARMRNSVEQMLEIEIDEEKIRTAGTFDQLGNNLGALSFLIDMLNYQPVLAKKLFVYDDVKGELRPLMGRTEKSGLMEVPIQVSTDPLPAEVVAVVSNAASESAEHLTAKLDALAVNAALADQPALAQTARLASLAAAAHDSDGTVQALQSLAGVVATVPGTQSIQPVVSDFDEDDLRDIFLEEAREVSSNGLEAVRLLRSEPGDIEQLTILRRVFHTLKGSARMVGLNEFGEAGWAMEQLFNGWLADQKPASDEFLLLSETSLIGFSRWIEDISANNAVVWNAATFRLSAEAMLSQGSLLPLALPGLAFVDPMVAPAELPATHPITAVQFPVTVSAVASDVAHDVLVENQVDIDADFDFFAENAEPADPTILDELRLQPTAEVPQGQSKPQILGIDFDSLSALSGVPEGPATASALAEIQMQSAPDQQQQAVTPLDAAAESLEIEDLQRQLDAFNLLVPDVPAQIAGELSDIDLVDLSADDFDAQFFQPTDAVAPEPETQAVLASPGTLMGSDEVVKVIGDLRIGIPLYNVYLNEADEWSRRLVAELSEWAMERKEPVGDSTVSFAHSLAGSSATVGFLSLSEIARALEHALLKSQAHYSAKSSARYADILVASAEDMRRLLHQFAAGFLKSADTELIAKLDAIDFSLADLELELDAEQPVCVVESQADVAAVELPDFDFSDEPKETPVAPRELAVPRGSSTSIPPAVLSAAVLGTVATFGAVAFVKQPVTAFAAPTLQATVSSTTQSVDDADDEIDAVDALDAELFPIFDEEATELMPQLGSALRQWSARPDNLGARQEVLRTLHTLKGSARLAGALRLGEMAHRIESEIEFLGSDAAATQDFEPLLTRYDAMQHTLDVLRSGEVAAADPVLTKPDVVDAAVGTQPKAAEPASQAATPHETADSSMILAAEPTEFDAASAADALGTAESAVGPASPGRVLIPAPQGMAMQPLRQAATASIRVRSQLLDRMVNQAGEVMITRSRLEVELGQLRGSLGDMTDNLNRLRQQLRDIELQAETQMQSRLAQAKELQAGFDPLEFDRFTRVQELTRMMAESVNDVATVQRTLQRTVEATEDDLIAQARQTRELQRDLLKTRMVEFEGISDRLYRVVRLASKETGKQVKLDLLGGTIEMDRGMLDRMTPAFEHLLRNCVAHGIESPDVRSAAGKQAAGLITVHLRQEGNDVSVEFSDDGGGLDLGRIRQKAISSGLIGADQIIDDQQAADLIFTPGFTTAAQVSELAGRGIGMDVVRTEVNSVGGRIETSSVLGHGTQFKLILPLTTAVTQVVMIRSGQLAVGVPATVVETVRRVTGKELQQAYNTGNMDVAGEAVPFFWSGALLQSSSKTVEVQGKTASVVVFRSASQRVALHVDEVMGNQEVVVKNLGPQLSRLPGLAGMSVLASGAVVLIYNPVALASVYGAQARVLGTDSAEPHMLEGAGVDSNMPTTAVATVAQIPLVMVVDDSITVRRVTQRLLQREGYRVVLAADGLQALERLQEERPSVVLSDIEMPRMDGFDLARNIRADARLSDLPIVMITSRIAEKHREYAKELGVDHYLGKPYPEDELMALVRMYCGAEATA